VGSWTDEIVNLEAVKEESAQTDKRININAASEEELCTLPGIGPKRAKQIMTKREEKRFTRITQLIQIRGIGWKTLRRLRPLIFIGPPGGEKKVAGKRKFQDASICAVPLKPGGGNGMEMDGSSAAKPSAAKPSAVKPSAVKPSAVKPSKL